MNTDPSKISSFSANLFKPLYIVEIKIPESESWIVSEPYSKWTPVDLGLKTDFGILQNAHKSKLDQTVPLLQQGVPPGSTLTFTAFPSVPVLWQATYLQDGHKWYKLDAKKPENPPKLSRSLAKRSEQLQPDGVGQFQGYIQTEADNNKITAREKNVIEAYLGANECDILVFGPSVCAPTDSRLRDLIRWYVSRRSIVMLSVVLTFALLLFIIQSLTRLTRKRMLRNNDPYMLELLETTFMTLALVAVATALAKLIFSWDILQQDLEHLVFNGLFRVILHGEIQAAPGDTVTTLPNMRPIVPGEVMNSLVTTFVGRVEDFVIIYTCFALIFGLMAHSDFLKLRRTEDMTLAECLADKSLVGFVVARYEYKDRVSSRIMAGLDYQTGWFVEYYHAALLMTSCELLRIPLTTLAMFSLGSMALYPLHRVYRYWSVLITLIIAALAPLGLVFVCMRCLRVKYYLMPRNPEKYISLRYQLDHGVDLYTEDQITILSNNMPRYKTMPVPDFIVPGIVDDGITFLTRYQRIVRWLIRAIFGTLKPNRHEDLFFFKKKGPSVLFRITEGCFLILLCVSAYLLEQLDSNSRMWLIDYGYLPIMAMGVILVSAISLMPTVLNLLTFVSTTGMMLREPLLTNVISHARSLFVEKVKFFMDAVRCAITLQQMFDGGDILYQNMMREANKMGHEARESANIIWDSLTCDSDGIMDEEVVFVYFNQQGINLRDSHQVRPWLRLFGDRHTIPKEDFIVMMMVVNEMISTDSLEPDTLKEWIVQRGLRGLRPGDGMSLIRNRELHPYRGIAVNTPLSQAEEHGAANFQPGTPGYPQPGEEPPNSPYVERLPEGETGLGIGNLITAKEVGLLLRTLDLDDMWQPIDMKHFLTYLSGNPHVNSLTLDEFTHAIVDVDKTTVGALNEAAFKIKKPKLRTQRPEPW